MSYQAGLLGIVSSATRGVSIATLLYRQTPEYKAKAELKAEAEKKQIKDLKAQQNVNPKVQKAQELMDKAKDERRAAIARYEDVFRKGGK